MQVWCCRSQPCQPDEKTLQEMWDKIYEMIYRFKTDSEFEAGSFSVPLRWYSNTIVFADFYELRIGRAVTYNVGGRIVELLPHVDRNARTLIFSFTDKFGKRMVATAMRDLMLRAESLK
jgi:hypothetical protein